MSEYYRRALRQMDINRTEKIAAARARSEAFFAEHPELDTLQKDIAAVTRESFVAMRRGQIDADELEDFSRRRIARIRQIHEDAVRACGMDPASLEPQWDCSLCEDTGYTTTQDGNRKMCVCLKRLAAALAVTQEQYRPDRNCTFESFDLTCFPEQPDPVENEKYSQREWMRRLEAFCREYAETFRVGKSTNLLFVGQTGLGKTFLAHCIANHVANSGSSVCFLTAYNLSNLMFDAYMGKDAALDMERALLTCDLLVIDDLGSEPMRRNVNLESFFSLLNERSIAKRPVIVCSNYMPNALRDRYGERIISRMISRDTKPIQFYGKDIRRT